MNEHQMDRALRETPPVDPRLLESISGAILPDLAPVRPLAAPRRLAALVMACSAAAAFAGAFGLGFLALHRLTAGQAAALFPLLAILIWLGAAAAASSMIPGARQLVRPWPLVCLASALLAGIFALIFRDYSTVGFVRAGIACLTAGLLDALPAAVLTCLVLRRGFAVNAAAAGAAVGTVAGLAGFLMLELHCPLLQAPHAMLWHVAVIPLSAAGGALLGKSRRRRAP